MLEVHSVSHFSDHLCIPAMKHYELACKVEVIIVHNTLTCVLLEIQYQLRMIVGGPAAILQYFWLYGFGVQQPGYDIILPHALQC